ncbi:hypothetical protein CBR64_20880 [Cellulosimicrobium cellulans]|uniref:Uncharacterized protein n=1 Tax=Cellulosimicrobium cellulans TaxID=1710 RepID=A0A1Y0I202_CELCE|nr:hypothetical protein [Cellulosimicrobium cellulans]ARU53514.1 hypothetical protein CBR64_20880 [Cellulosimicrobium cellulans]
MVQSQGYSRSSLKASAVAAARVRRTISRGRQMSVEAAAAAYWLRPGHTITVQLPTGPQERHLVSSVTFDLPSGTMHVRTRVPVDVTITTGE